MISSQPEKLLRYLLPSIGDGNNFLALHLGGLIFKLEFVKKTVGELHYKLSIVTFDNPSVEEPEENVVASQNIVAHLTKEECPYKHVASFVCKALPEYVIMHKGMEAERSLAHCHLYMVKANNPAPKQPRVEKLETKPEVVHTIGLFDKFIEILPQLTLLLLVILSVLYACL